MTAVPIRSRTKFLGAAAASLAATLFVARTTSEAWTLTVSGWLLVTVLCLPFVMMVCGLATMFLGVIFHSPEALLIILVLLMLSAQYWQIPVMWVLAVPVLMAVGYMVVLLRWGPKLVETPIPFRIYEFGADRILPYYAWLISSRRAVICGVLFGILIGIATIWGAGLWHAVDSPGART